jgi:hypothetical protein
MNCKRLFPSTPHEAAPVDMLHRMPPTTLHFFVDTLSSSIALLPQPFRLPQHFSFVMKSASTNSWNVINLSWINPHSSFVVMEPQSLNPLYLSRLPMHFFPGLQSASLYQISAIRGPVPAVVQQLAIRTHSPWPSTTKYVINHFRYNVHYP